MKMHKELLKSKEWSQLEHIRTSEAYEEFINYLKCALESVAAEKCHYCTTLRNKRKMDDQGSYNFIQTIAETVQ